LAVAALVGCWSGSWAHADTCAGSRFALVIGDKAYPDNDSVLSEPGGNAKRVAESLKQLGFQTIVDEDLSKARMQAAIDDLQGKITSKTLVFFFFSGFGVQSDHHTYLIPVDAAIWSDQDVRTHGLSLDRILAGFEAKGARAQILVIDAARRNPFERRFRAAGSAGLAAVSGANNLLTIFSTAPEAVFDSTDAPTSPFVDELVKAMEEPGAAAEDAFRRTRTRVSHISRAGQQPWVSSSLKEDFTLGGDGCPAAGDGRSAHPATRPPEAPQPAPVHATTRVQDGADAPAVKDQEAAVTPPPRARPVAQDFQIVLDDPSLVEEIRDRLYERGFNPTGNGAASWEDIIRKYEKANGLPDAGRPTKGLLQSLRDAVPLKPWGTITVAYQGSRVTNWGMSWGAPTRRQASNLAKSRCGSGACNQELGFYGKSCGAFALSPYGWSARYADTSGAAKDSALDDCGKHGGQCRIIGSVCADGSERTN
jgi:hypothetical protein